MQCVANLLPNTGVGDTLPSTGHPEGADPVAVISYLTTPNTHRLVDLVAKASASRAEDPGFESRLRRNFFGVESYQ